MVMYGTTNKISMGMHEMLDHRISELKESVNSYVDNKKKEILKLKDEDKIKKELVLSEKVIYDYGRSIYSKFAKIAGVYITTDKYDNEVKIFLYEKLKELQNCRISKLEKELGIKQDNL